MEDSRQVIVDIDSLRDEYESSSEWRLRRKFLEFNCDSLSHDRLVCLSKCFVNLVVYGCSYPETVMAEVRERSMGVFDEVDAEKKAQARQKYATSFLKAASGSDTLSTVSSESARSSHAYQKPPLSSAQTESRQNASKVHGRQTEESIQDWKYSEAAVDSLLKTRPSDQNSKTAEVNITPSDKNSLTPPVNSRSTTQNSKTVLSKEECLIACQKERHPVLRKIRNLAYEVLNSKVAYKKARLTLDAACKRVPVHIYFKIEQHLSGKAKSFVCYIIIEGVVVASGKGSSKTAARTDARERALRVIMMPHIEIRESNEGRRELRGSEDPDLCQSFSGPSDADVRCVVDSSSFAASSEFVTDPPRLDPKENHLKFLEGFIVCDRITSAPFECGAYHVLQQSVKFNCVKMKLEYQDQQKTTRCSIRFNNEVVAEAEGKTKKKSKSAASEQCLAMLKKMCWVLKIKEAMDPSTEITRDEIERNLMSSILSEDSIGKRLMQKMGWLGGGLGKDGSGVIEPVLLTSVFNRKGLGHSRSSLATLDFRRRLKEFIQNYAVSDDPSSLVFSSEFDDAEQNVICSMCRKLKLCSTLQGKGPARFVRVSKRTSVSQIFEYVMSHGGETPKYKLVPPESGDYAGFSVKYCDSFSAVNCAGTSRVSGDFQKLTLSLDKNPDMKHNNASVCDVVTEVNVKPQVPVNEYVEHRKEFPAPVRSFVVQSQNVSELPLAEHKTDFPVSLTNSSTTLISQDKFEFKFPSFECAVDGLKFLERFVVVEFVETSAWSNAFNTLMKSGDFNNMNFRFEYHHCRRDTCCIIRINNSIVTEAYGWNKNKARATASAQCLQILKKMCWVLKIKQQYDSNIRISRVDIEGQVQLKLDPTNQHKIGNELLQTCGSGCELSECGSSVAQTSSAADGLKQDVEFSKENGSTAIFRQCLREVVQSYAVSNDLGDLVFSCEFDDEEGKVIQNECQKLQLCSTFCGKRLARLICVSRKMSARQVLEYVISCGGETPKYKLLPPGSEEYAAPSVKSCESSRFLSAVNTSETLDEDQRIIVFSEKVQDMKHIKNSGCDVASEVNTAPHVPGNTSVEGGKEFIVLEKPSVPQNQNLCQPPLIKSSLPVSEFDMKLPSFQCRKEDLLEGFIVIEDIAAGSSYGPFKTLKKCAAFNRVRLNLKYVHKELATRCMIMFNNQVLAEVEGTTKKVARAAASAQCLMMLRKMCWLLEIKQPVDSNTRISRNEIQNKMCTRGLSGERLGKHGSGAENVHTTCVLNREGVRVGKESGVRQCLREVVQSYAASDDRDDLVFSCEFDDEERQFISSECHKLKLWSTVRGKGQEKYVCVSRKMSASQIFEYVMSCGGETPKYKLLPPGSDEYGVSSVKSSNGSRFSLEADLGTISTTLDECLRPAVSLDSILDKASKCEISPVVVSPQVHVNESLQDTREFSILEGSYLLKNQNFGRFPANKSGTDTHLSAKRSSNVISQRDSEIEFFRLKYGIDYLKYFESFIVLDKSQTAKRHGAFKTMKRCASFNSVTLTTEFMQLKKVMHCTVIVNKQVVAEGEGTSRKMAKNRACTECLRMLRKVCWTLQVKQHVDSNKIITRDEIQNQIKLKSDQMNQCKTNNNLPQNMDWLEGGGGKDHSDISEVSSVPAAMSPEGLGFSKTNGVTADFEQHLREVVQNYAASGDQEKVRDDERLEKSKFDWLGSLDTSKTAELNTGTSNQNPPALASSSPETQNSKTVLADTRQNLQNSMTALTSTRHDRAKTAQDNMGPDTQNSKITSTSSGPGSAQNLKTALTKEECLNAFKRERDPVLQKIRKLAYEVLNLKATCQNAKEALNSAGNRVPILIDFNIKPVPGANTSSFLCHVVLEGITVSSGKGTNMKSAKTSACEMALKVIMMPQIEIVESKEGGRELQVMEGNASQNENLTNSSDSSSGHVMSYKESGLMAGGFKRKMDDLKFLEGFIIVEKMDTTPGCEAARILRESADFNHVSLEFDYVSQGVATRCKVRIENHIVTDAVGTTKNMARDAAAARCLEVLKKMCWVMKIKQHVDANTSISKDEIESHIKLKSDQISQDNIGKKMLQKMGWSGGGVGKDGSGISEPISLTGVVNREGLGLGSASGITDNFRRRIQDVIQQYASSDNQGDVVFSCEFDIEERKVIHEVCRKLSLRSTSRGKGQERYLCVSRKMSANQLFDRVMSCGGETHKYKLLPPGSDVPMDEGLGSE